MDTIIVLPVSTPAPPSPSSFDFAFETTDGKLITATVKANESRAESIAAEIAATLRYKRVPMPSYDYHEETAYFALCVMSFLIGLVGTAMSAVILLVVADVFDLVEDYSNGDWSMRWGIYLGGVIFFITLVWTICDEVDLRKKNRAIEDEQ